MPASRLLALLLACGIAAAAIPGVSAAPTARNYMGDARSISLTAAQAKFTKLTGSVAAQKPPADKQIGYRTGWQASYLKGTTKAPVQAYSLVYVYATPSDAQRAYANSCGDCTGNVTTAGVRMKFRLTGAETTPGVIDIARCRNVYAAIVVTGKVGTAALARTAGALAGTIYAKAMAGGMSRCAGS
jgi:hypothetical protein